MEQNQRILTIQNLIPYLETYNASGQVKMDTEARQQLKNVYADIYGINNPDINCSTCVIHYLNMLLSWYEREFAIWSADQVAKPIDVVKRKKNS